ncbi:hypothetical protein BT63DRAFT_205513 [Microthyrium microscopicum]|uniref:DEK C-terminal domain-containing protein n=1 Tax=Microthyrium microscopicum TaxID=703497 RepID=A0A6A6UHR2_9PEZI|nr:hypothetical protein BT63DRAFT_205513 [Microthyrium microscopicum]
MAPNAKRIETALRRAIDTFFDEDDQDAMTVTLVRKKAEEKLDLDAGWFKQHAEWNKKSKLFIQEDFARRTEEPEEEDEQFAKELIEEQPKRGRKRASEGIESNTPKKKQKAAPKAKKGTLKAEKVTPAKKVKPMKRAAKSETPDSASELSAEVSASPSTVELLKQSVLAKPTKSTAASRRKATVVEDSEDSDDSDYGSDAEEGATKEEAVDEDAMDVDEDQSPAEERPAKKTPQKSPTPKKATPAKTSVPNSPTIENPDVAVDENLSESDMSVLIDDGPVPKRKKKSSEPKGKKDKTTKPTKPKAATKDTSDPDDAEIKKLQKQLTQCGVRKMWWRELKDFDTPKEKIRHLRQKLKDIGMTGRFSADKASEIKERLELEADLEAVQEYAERHGKRAEEEREKAKPVRDPYEGIELDSEED